MDYNFRDIEKKWQQNWVENKTYKVTEDNNKKKFYVLNMFPYPSGAGLHVGHPLGYIASDIYARYKRQQGFNVLNPMGYDAYGLPAEQYAIQTGQHPAITTDANIAHYREQLDKIGGFEAYKEFVHFGLTSQDINNTSVPLSIKEALEQVYYPLLEELI